MMPDRTPVFPTPTGPPMSPDPITTLAAGLDELGRVRFAFNRDDERQGYITEALTPALAALEQVRTLVEAARAVRPHYRDLDAALLPFTSGDTESG